MPPPKSSATGKRKNVQEKAVPPEEVGYHPSLGLEVNSYGFLAETPQDRHLHK